ncbi:MAG TPA: hypothetical protein VMX12_12145 [Acidimicrobiia bacterium]|nr:hypothetical protein [Acidimicrobiia bacterium]
MTPTRYYFKIEWGLDHPEWLFRLTFPTDDKIQEERWDGSTWVSARPSLLNRLIDGDPYLSEVEQAEAEKWFPEAFQAAEAAEPVAVDVVEP